MNLEQFTDADGPMARRYEYDDETVLVVDFGNETETAVDVVDDTVIVVRGDDQHEIDLPDDGEASNTFIRNGVLSVELEAGQ